MFCSNRSFMYMSMFLVVYKVIQAFSKEKKRGYIVEFSGVI